MNGKKPLNLIFHGTAPHQVEVIGAVGGQLVDEAAFHFSFLDDEYAGHLKTVAQLRANPVAGNYARREAPYPGGKPEELGKIALHQSESCVELTFRVTDVYSPVQAVTVEVAFRNIVGRHVDEYDPGTLFFDLAALFGDIRQGFPAECTSEMAQKD